MTTDEEEQRRIDGRKGGKWQTKFRIQDWNAEMDGTAIAAVFSFIYLEIVGSKERKDTDL
jgi:hypothetical protein